jgi:hypothetical protein
VCIDPQIHHTLRLPNNDIPERTSLCGDLELFTIVPVTD